MTKSDATFAAALRADFAKHGEAVIQRLRLANPNAYLKLHASMSADSEDFSNMSLEELEKFVVSSLIFLSSSHGPLWNVSFLMEPPRDVEMEIRAATSRDALLSAILKIQPLDGELFHSVHIGKPHDEEVGL